MKDMANIRIKLSVIVVGVKHFRLIRRFPRILFKTGLLPDCPLKLPFIVMVEVCP
jgi:hypothetical protein